MNRMIGYRSGLTGSAAVALLLAIVLTARLASASPPEKKRLIVVDSYHREYIWSQHTNQGFCDAMLSSGYFDNAEQVKEFIRSDQVETSRAVIRKLWMDAKRKSTKEEMARSTIALAAVIREFKPHLIFLGDDDAVDYLGNQFVDTGVPVVFWGVNTNPVKYGLVNSAGRPGHNVTGIYQTTYYAESLALLKKIVPKVRSFAILTDDTTTGRVHAKSIQFLVEQGRIPIKLVETVMTNDSDRWRRRALELQNKVDAFFVAQFSGLRDSQGNAVPDVETAAWYLENIKIPEAAGFLHRVVLGMLCAADDSGYNQGYEAVLIARDILEKKANPAVYPTRTPKRGPLMVNRQRAAMLGITLTPDMGIEQYIDDAAALSR